MNISFPKYSIKLPSGKKVSFRPFTVKEENSLLIAKESQNNSNILQTLTEIMSSCFNEDVSLFSIADYECAFLNLRGRSVGEIEKATIKCPETKEQVKVVIDCIKDMQIKQETKSNLVQLTDKKIKLKELTIKQILKNPNYNTSFEDKINFIAEIICHLEQEREIISFDDLPLQEKINFVLNLPAKDFKNILNYFENQTKVFFILNYTVSDNNKKSIELSGLLNIISFFLIT